MMTSAKADAAAPGAACWDCGGPLEAVEDVCAACGAPQPAPEGDVDLFAFLGVAPSLVLDASELQRLFHDRSRRLHPDRFGAASAQAQEHSMTRSALLNRAYRTLQDPRARRAYLLEAEREALALEPVAAGERNVPVELAEEYFEMQEALAGGDLEALGRIERRLSQIQEENQIVLDHLAERWEREGLGRARLAGQKLGERAAFAGDLEKALQMESYLRRMEENVGKAAAGGGAG